MIGCHFKNEDIAQRLAVVVVFLLVFPTALVNLAVLLLLIAFFLPGKFAGKWERLHFDPVVRSALLLLALFVISLLYTPLGFADAVSYLNKYHELLLLPMMMAVVESAYWKKVAYYAFLLAITLMVGLSYAMYLGWLPPGPPGQEWVPLTSRIFYGFALAYAVYLMIHHAVQATTFKHRMLWLLLACVSAFDLLFLISGRTGHVIMLCLLALLWWQYWRQIRSLPYWPLLLLGVMASCVLVLTTSPALHGRQQDVELAWTAPESSSIGQRLIFWETSLHVIADHPLMGTGVGSFAQVYAGHNREHPDLYADNPHNEYLLIATQLGVVGLAAFIGLLVVQYRASARLPSRYRYAAQGLVVAMAVGCLFNSFLRDHGEGHLFAIFAGLLFAPVPDEQVN